MHEEGAIAGGKRQQIAHGKRRQGERRADGEGRQPPGHHPKPRAEEQVDGGHRKRERRDEPDQLDDPSRLVDVRKHVGYHRSVLASSTFTLWRRR